MKYKNIVEGKFLERPNRFISYCEIDNNIEKVHVKNTGKCKELLIPNCKVYLEESDNPNRKTKYSLIAVQKDNRLINMDSQVPNKVVYEALVNNKISLPGLNENIIKIKPETTYENSRFDIYIETENKRAFIEVKGVTLEEDDIVMFPDAKTERGVKHINELIAAKNLGYYAYILFVVQMSGMKYLIPNDDTHKAFGDALRYAHSCGVNVLAYECAVEPNRLEVTCEIAVKLD